MCNQNRYWEANLKDKRPSESNIDMWIRAKYDQKRWAMRGPIPDPSTLGGDDDEVCFNNIWKGYKVLMDVYVYMFI